MFGYIFETTNIKTGDVYIGKKYSVAFDKNYLGEDMNDGLAVAIEKYGRPAFVVKMKMPYESKEQIDAVYEALTKKAEPKKKVVVSEKEVVEEKPKTTRKKRAKAVEE